MVCVNENKIGLKSSFTFKCNFCLKMYTLDSESSEANMMDINITAVAGIMNVGGGFSQLQTMTAFFEIPPSSQFVYNKSHDIVCKSFNECATKEMEAAAKEEAQLAISATHCAKRVTQLLLEVRFKSHFKLLIKILHGIQLDIL